MVRPVQKNMAREVQGPVLSSISRCRCGLQSQVKHRLSGLRPGKVEDMYLQAVGLSVSAL
jgi:hypothetical protein